MVAGKDDFLFGERETDVPGGMPWCDKRLEPPACGHQRLPMTKADIDVKGCAEALKVGEDLCMRFHLRRWQAVLEKLLLGLVVQAGLHPLPGRALNLPHEDLRA